VDPFKSKRLTKIKIKTQHSSHQDEHKYLTHTVSPFSNLFIGKQVGRRGGIKKNALSGESISISGDAAFQSRERGASDHLFKTIAGVSIERTDRAPQSERGYGVWHIYTWHSLTHLILYNVLCGWSERKMVSLTSPAPKCWSRNSDEDVDSTNGLAIGHADRTY